MNIHTRPTTPQSPLSQTPPLPTVTEAQSSTASSPSDPSLPLTDQLHLDPQMKAAKAAPTDPSGLLFDDTPPKSNAPEISERLSYGGFALENPDLGGRLISLRQAFAPGEQNTLNPDRYSVITQPPKNVARMDVYGETSRQIQSFSDIKTLNQETIHQHLSQSLGRTPTEAEVKAYLQENGNAMAQMLGDDLSDKYSSFTSVGLTGDVNTLDPFRSGGSDDNSIVVCTNIHASVAAYRQEVLGQEAYVMTTNGNDQAHIVTVYFDPAKESWNIQNYGTIVETQAKDLRQLFEEYLPDQRHITLGSVKEDKISLTRDTRTPLGEREYRFRSQLGAGEAPLNTQSGNFIEVGNRELSAGLGGLKISFDPTTTTAALNYHQRAVHGNQEHIRGLGIEAQDHTNDLGFQRQRIDAKYESQKVTHEQRTPSHEKYTRSYVNVHAGIEDTSEDGPIYWANNTDSGPAARVGAFYSHTQNNLYGNQPLRLEWGTQFNAGLTATVGTQGEDFYSQYVTRTLGDAVLEGQTNVGLRYDKAGFSARAGLTPRIDLANINGIQNVGQQLNNTFELDAYGEVSYQGDRGKIALMTQADLRHAGVFEVGAMSQLNLTEKLSWGNSFSHQNDPVLGNRTGWRTGLQYEPLERLNIYGNVGTNLKGQGQFGIGAAWRFD